VNITEEVNESTEIVNETEVESSAEFIKVDLDNDGVVDTILIDEDGDGIYDTEFTREEQEVVSPEETQQTTDEFWGGIEGGEGISNDLETLESGDTLYGNVRDSLTSINGEEPSDVEIREVLDDYFESDEGKEAMYEMSQQTSGGQNAMGDIGANSSDDLSVENCYELAHYLPTGQYDGLSETVANHVMDNEDDNIVEEVNTSESETSFNETYPTHENSDNEGYEPVVIEEIDMDGDGIVDAAVVDIDGNEVADSLLLDTDGDGVLDTAIIDIDEDGVPDAIAIDSNNDGTADLIMADTTGDGEIDTVIENDDMDDDDDFENDNDEIAGLEDDNMEEWT
jgi:hypothetical protein